MPRGIYKRTKTKGAKAKLKVAKPKTNRRKWRVAIEAAPFGVTDEVVQDDIAHEKVRDEFNIIKWINAADTPAERHLRKAAMHGVLYSGGLCNDEGGLLKAAERIRNGMAESKAREAALAKEGVEMVPWPGNAYAKEDWRADDGDLARPFNPDSLFVKPPIHHDPVNHPAHYLRHPSGVECITITEHFNFNRGNAIKYIWRADEKGGVLENLRKAAWYLNREIKRLEKEALGQ